MRIVIAVHDPPIWSLPAPEVERIRRSLPGDDVVDVRDAGARLRELPAADVLLATHLTDNECAAATRTRWIHTTAVGAGGLLRPGIVSSPIVVTNSRGVHAGQIAEHAVAMLLALRRGLHVARTRQLERQWAQQELWHRGVEPLSESHLLVVGLGAIGSRVAALGRGLGMRVSAIRRRTAEPAPAGVTDVRPPAHLLEALPTADAVVLAAPRTAETKQLIGRAELAVMRPSAFLVNVARGQLVDEDALIDALRTGRIAGAGLDAFALEPLPPGSPLWTLPNVLVTPHSASFDGNYWGPAVDLFLDNVERFKRGDPLRNVVDKTRGY